MHTRSAPVRTGTSPAATDAKLTKGQKSKARIEAAARVVFGRHGYRDTRVIDIAAEAGFSLGAFYRYFKDKGDVLRAVLVAMFEEGYLGTYSGESEDVSDPFGALYRSTRQSLQMVADNADLYRVVWETGQIEHDIELLWHEYRERFRSRIENALLRAQQAGSVRASIDPELASKLLAGMTENFGYLYLVRLLDGGVSDIEAVSREIADLWSHAVLAPVGTPVDAEIDPAGAAGSA